MKLISWLEQALITGTLLKEMAPPLRRSRTEKALMALFALLGLAGLGFLLYGGFSWAAAEYGNRDAALLTGAASWVLALLCGAVFCALKLKQKQRLKDFGKYSEDTFANILKAIEGPIRENPKLGVFLAILAGYKAGQTIQEEI
jgi:TRAP-type C4-dicarboxylate transport system permease small subunit